MSYKCSEGKIKLEMYFVLTCVLAVPFSQPLAWRIAAAAALHVFDSMLSDSGLTELAH